MSTKKLSNISLKEYRLFLTNCGCKYIRTSGGHEIWSRTDLNRPITFQTHIDPVPERIIKQALRILLIGNNPMEMGSILDKLNGVRTKKIITEMRMNDLNDLINKSSL